MTALDRFTAALEAHGCKGSGANWHCPEHDDRSASLSVQAGVEGVLVKCHAGCATKDVVAALGLTMGDLFDTPPRQTTAVNLSVTLEQLAAAKKLPVEFLKNLGLHDGRRGKAPVVHMPYPGEPDACKDRVAVKGKPSTKWHTGHHARPYTLTGWQQTARDAGYLLIGEGESDCWTAKYHGVPIIGMPGKSTWQPEWAAEVRALNVPVYVQPWQIPTKRDIRVMLTRTGPLCRVGPGLIA